ncbi:MAG: hypothetical protein R3D62_14670 [Xanthobacteraceae bacterium]
MTSISNAQVRRIADGPARSRIAIATALVALVLGASVVAPAQADSRRGGREVHPQRIIRLQTRPSSRATPERRADRVPARPGRGHADRVPARPGRHAGPRIRDFRD